MGEGLLEGGTGEVAPRQGYGGLPMDTGGMGPPWEYVREVSRMVGTPIEVPDPAVLPSLGRGPDGGYMTYWVPKGPTTRPGSCGAPRGPTARAGPW